MKRVFLFQLLALSVFGFGACQKRQSDAERAMVERQAQTTTSAHRAPTTPGRLVAPSVLKSKMELIGTPAPEPTSPAQPPPDKQGN
jgi:hypothetical protein